jgi:hypothetical protein
LRGIDLFGGLALDLASSDLGPVKALVLNIIGGIDTPRPR